jgi:transposase-like protein
MAHPIQVKAQAMAMLMTGDAVTYVAKRLGVPKQTVSRWKVDADQLLRECLKGHPALEGLATVRRDLQLFGQNGTKKRVRVR